MSEGQAQEGNGVRPPLREEPDWPPFAVEPRCDWHEMVAEEEAERAAAEEMRQRAVDAAMRRAERRNDEEEADVLLHAAAARERERAAEEMRQPTADAAMCRAERRAAGVQDDAVMQVDSEPEGSESAFSGVELSDGGAVEWIEGERAPESDEGPGPFVVVQEHRVEWVVGLRQPRVELHPDDDENWDSDGEATGAESRPVEIPMFRPAPERIARVAADAPPRQSRSARHRACRYNPNRHLERED